jgi:hypothetical protein
MPPVLLDSPETLRRIIAGIRWVERIRGSTYQEHPLQGAIGMGPPPVTVRVESSTKVDGTYDGVVMRRNTLNADAWFLVEEEGVLEEVRILEVNDKDLEETDRYVGYIVGEYEFGSFKGMPLVVVQAAVGMVAFHARLESGSGEGPWTVQPLAYDGGWGPNGPPVTDVYCKAQEDAITPAPDVGDIVWVKQSELNPEEYEFISDPVYGCGIYRDPDLDEIRLDLTGVAQEPLEWDDAQCELSLLYGCGLNVLDGELVVDLTSVVFDGLYFDAEICALGVLIGCGLEYGAGEVIKVDYSELVGDYTLTSLVTLGVGSNGCESIGVDLEDTNTSSENLMEDVSIALTCGGTSISVTVSKTYRTYTNYFNAAGLHINRLAGSTSFSEETDQCYLDIDVLCDCCEAGPPTALIDEVSSESGSTGEAGTYEVVLTVTDACGRTDTDTVIITITEPLQTGCCEDPIPTTLYVAFSSATGDCTCLNGLSVPLVYNGTTGWAYFDFLCGWTDRFSFLLSCDGVNWSFVSDTGVVFCGGASTEVSIQCDPLSLVYDLDIANGDCCTGTVRLTITATPP